ncbi:TonB-dependent receptor domain-containing protein [Fulvivirga lutimaris]|uniref:TonB-dependent receptor domain-containing protein n=1 Tax=Fulvivirga lutimaris TaxID=1819566 RepID=UPI0012BB5039|nr:TonB-dependent receptor [Fulvivirga lutimaris]MTI39856.1 TonB-dependent receptor [Fulvivirga lutimaris]
MIKFRALLPLLIVVLSFLISPSFAQITVSGTITESGSGKSLVGVTIVAKSSGKGSATDINGRFQLELPSPDSLFVSYIGYKSMIVKVTESITLNLQLEVDTKQLNAVEITAPKIIELKLPASFMQIPKEHLKRDNGTTIAPALNRITGVYMHSGALNTNRITIRGIGNRSLFSTTKIRAYLDDIPLTTGDGETTIEDIDLSLVQKVDVWKGPTASLYGAGLGGMIHYKTRDQENFMPTSLSTKLTAGSYGLIRNVSEFNFTNDNKTLNTVLNYNNTSSEGYRDNNEYDRESLTLIGKSLSSKVGKTTLFGSFAKLKAFIPSSIDRNDYENSPQNAAFTWGNVKGFEDYTKVISGLSHEFKITELKGLEVLNRTSLFYTNRDAYESTPFNILEEKSSTYGLRNVIELQKQKSLTTTLPILSIGIETFSENYDWQTFETNNGIKEAALSDNEEQRKYINLFAQSYFEITTKATLFAGINFNNTSYDYNDLLKSNGIDKSGDYGFDYILSPHLGLNYQFNKNVALFSTISHGFSPPSLEETLTPEGTINPDIQVEKGWNYEFGARGSINTKLTYELSVYTMQVKDLLVARRVNADQFIGVNAGETKHNGLELFLAYEFTKNSNWQITPFLSYTYSDYTFKEFIDEDNDYSGNKLTGTPPHQLSAGVDFNSSIGFYGNINYKYVDAFPMRDDNSIDSEAYQLVRAKIGYQRNLSNRWKIDTSFGIDNVLDEKYASMILINAGSFGNNPPRYYYPGLPRNYFGSLTINYRL